MVGLGNPPIATSGFESWAPRLAAAAEPPNIFAKLSVLDEGPGDRWSAANPWRSIDHALATFGLKRLIYGSDWPVSILKGGYQKAWREVNVATCQLGPEERARIFGCRAIEVYRLANLSQAALLL